MKHWNAMFANLLALLVMIGVSQAEAQEVNDTLRITVRGDLAVAEIVEAEVTVRDLRIGQQGVLIARAYDSDGDPVPATFFWTSSAPDTLSVVATSDSTALITAHHKSVEGVVIHLTATDKTDLLIAAWRSADRKFLGFGDVTLNCAARPDSTLVHLTAVLAEEAAAWCSADLCAYAIRAGKLVVQSALPPECPLLFEPAEESERPLSSRIVPFGAIASVAALRRAES